MSGRSGRHDAQFLIDSGPVLAENVACEFPGEIGAVTSHGAFEGAIGFGEICVGESFAGERTEKTGEVNRTISGIGPRHEDALPTILYRLRKREIVADEKTGVFMEGRGNEESAKHIVGGRACHIRAEAFAEGFRAFTVTVRMVESLPPSCANDGDAESGQRNAVIGR